MPFLHLPLEPFGNARLALVSWQPERRLTDESRRCTSSSPIDDAAPTPPVPNRATSLAAERKLFLVPRDAIVAAVEALDTRITPPEPSAYASAVQSGEIQSFRDPYRKGRVSWVCHLIGDEEVIVIVPMRASSKEVERAVRELVEVVKSEMEPQEL